jgi:hypothetical protein
MSEQDCIRAAEIVAETNLTKTKTKTNNALQFSFLDLECLGEKARTGLPPSHNSCLDFTLSTVNQW